MNELHDRINRVINTRAFEACLEKHGVDLIEFQFSWKSESGGEFSKLPASYQEAILAGEKKLNGGGQMNLGDFERKSLFYVASNDIRIT